jgi:hypothetical protein
LVHDDCHRRKGGAVAADHVLELLDREQQVAAAASLVDEVLARGQSAALIPVLGRAVFREDAELHAYQTLEAGVRQFRALASTHALAARRTLVSISRYLAADAPTTRAQYQTYHTAERLLRDDDLTLATED